MTENSCEGKSAVLRYEGIATEATYEQTQSIFGIDELVGSVEEELNNIFSGGNKVSTKRGEDNVTIDNNKLHNYPSSMLVSTLFV